MAFHLLKNPQDPFSQRPHVPGVRQNPTDQRISAVMDPLTALDLFGPDRLREPARAADFQAVIEHPDRNGASLQGIVPVGEGVDQGLFPDEARVFEFFPEEKIPLQDSLLHPFFEQRLHFPDQFQEGRFPADPLNHIVPFPSPGFRSLETNELDSRPRMPAKGVAAEKVSRRPGEDRFPVQVFDQAVGAMKDFFRISRKPGPGDELIEQILIQIFQGAVWQDFPFMAGFNPGLPQGRRSLPGERNILEGDPEKAPAILQKMKDGAGRNPEEKQGFSQEFFGSNLKVQGRFESSPQQALKEASFLCGEINPQGLLSAIDAQNYRAPARIGHGPQGFGHGPEKVFPGPGVDLPFGVFPETAYHLKKLAVSPLQKLIPFLFFHRFFLGQG
jgi:hypothetical protein